MNAKHPLLASLFLALVTVGPAVAQSPAKVPVLGYMAQFAGPADPKSAPHQAFLQGLADLGYVDGKNIAIVYRYTEGKTDQMAAIAAELAAQKVDIIVTETGSAAVQAKKATQTIPIVMQASADAVGLGLAASLERPGGNVTGLTSLAPTASAKRLQLLAEIVPKLSRVGVLWSGPGFAVTDREWALVEAAAKPLGVQLYSLAARDATEIPVAFAEAGRHQVQAILQFDVPVLATAAARTQIIDLALKARLPMMFLFTNSVQQGGLIAYGVDGIALSVRAAGYVDRILKGANPAELAIRTPEKFVLPVNLKTAKAVGVTIPPSVLSQATTVIE